MGHIRGIGRLLIGCVTENNTRYRSQALRLVQSIRWFGGSLNTADVIVCVVEQADPQFVAKVEEWGASVRIVKRFSKRHPHSNKLRFFEIPEIDDYDVVMLLDCDTIIVQDPTKYIDGKHLQAEMAMGESVPHHVFLKVFQHYDMKMPNRIFETAVNKRPIIWYCNAGVLIFPRKIVQSFYPIWKDYTLDITKKKGLLGEHYLFCEQVSLSLAYAKHPVPFKKLPLSMNFPLTNKSYSNVVQCDPVIIHYHRKVNKFGFIKNMTKSPSAQDRIAAFNRQARLQRKEATARYSTEKSAAKKEKPLS